MVDVTENFDSGFLRVVVDSEFPITLRDTTTITRKLIKCDEFNNRYPNGCRIEISTPGVDMPLKKPINLLKILIKMLKFAIELITRQNQ